MADRVLAFALCALLLQTPEHLPQVAVVSSVHERLFPKHRVPALLDRLSAVLTAEGIPVALSPERVDQRLAAAKLGSVAACQGKVPCLMKVGWALNVEAVVSVEAGETVDDLAIRLVAYRSADGAELAKTTFVLFDNVSADLKTPMAPFAAKLRSSLHLPAPPSDAPLAAALAPIPPPALVLVQAPAQRPGPGPLVYASGAGAIALGVGAGVLAYAGLQQQNSVDPKTMTYSQGQGRIQEANNLYVGAQVAGAVAGALALATGYLWYRAQSE